MGFLSFLEKPFRTGRTAAAKNAAKAAEQQQEQFDEFAELFKPSIERGQGALKSLDAFSTIQGMDDYYNDIQDSEMFGRMVDDRTRAVESAMASSGLRRSGTRLQEAANVPTEIAMSLIDQLRGNTQNVASIGLGQGGNALGGLTGAFNASNAANQYGQIPGNNRAATMGGLIQMGAGLLGGLSDMRLKTNIQKIGEFGPLDVFSWDWVSDDIKGVMSTGFIAQDVQEVYPEHVHSTNIDGYELLTIDYPNLIEELQNV